MSFAELLEDLIRRFWESEGPESIIRDLEEKLVELKEQSRKDS